MIKTIRTIFGILLVFGSIYISHYLWYTGDVQNGSGLPSLFIILGGCGLGLYLIFVEIVNKTEGGKLIPLIFPLAIHGIMYWYHGNLREYKLLTEGKEIFGVVNFKGTASRGKSSGLEIRYNYEVQTHSYSKYSTDEEFIKKNNVSEGDTIIVRYWSQNPNYHTLKPYSSN